MRSSDAIRIVFQREIRTRLASSAFRIGIAITLLVVLAGATAIRVFSSEDETKLGLLGDNPPAAVESLRQSIELSGGTLEITEYDSRDDAVAALEAGDIDGVVVDGSELLVEQSSPDLLSQVSPAWQTANLVDGLATTGLDDAQVASALGHAAPLTMTELDVDPDRDARQGIAAVSVIVLFVTVQMTGAFIMMSVLEEKSSKVVELLLSSISARDLLIGKLLGSGLAGLVQMAVIIGALLVGIQIVGSDVIPDFSGWMFVAAVGCYLLGYLLFGSIMAAGAALVSRQEDAQAAMTPVTILSMLAYFASIFAATAPDETASRIVTSIPFVVPFALPGRIAVGNLTWWEGMIGVGGAIVAAGLLLSLAARIYTRSVLHTDRRIGWREAWSLGR